MTRVGTCHSAVSGGAPPVQNPRVAAHELFAAAALRHFAVCNHDALKGPIQDPRQGSAEGRSIPHQFIIVDEAQNLTPHEVKTIISRAGDGTKIVLTGDIEQIDNPYLDSSSNGLSYAVERLRGEGTIGHVTLLKSERSELASIAAARL